MRAAHRLAVDELVRHRVVALRRALARAEHARRHRAVRGHAALGAEDAAVALLPVDRDRQRLAQLAVLQLLLGRVALADHRVEPVEAEVPVVDVGDLREGEALGLVLALDAVGVVHVDAEVDAPLGPLDLGDVEVALLEHLLARHLLLDDGGDEGVDERHGLAAVVQQAGCLVAGLALAGIGLAAVVRVALHHVPAVLHVLGHHVRARCPPATSPATGRCAFMPGCA